MHLPVLQVMTRKYRLGLLKRSNASNKSGLRRQYLESIHLPSFRFSWKLKKFFKRKREKKISTQQ
jgi:hypothetical protein